MWAAFWDWLAKLPQGSASFLGSFAGASVGLVAILLGALVNAHLNRKRDDRLRQQDRAAVASTLYAELQGIHGSLLERADIIDNAPRVLEGQALVLPDLTIMLRPAVLPHLGLLPPETIRSVLNAYALAERYLGNLALIGTVLQPAIPGNRKLVRLDPSKVDFVAKLNQDTARSVKNAIDALLPYLN